jgi:hypothetical protein
MSIFEKSLKRLLSKPKDFTYHELTSILAGFGYTEQQGTGSRVVFKNERLNHKIKLHKPHPGNILKRYQIDLIIEELQKLQLL